MAKPKMVGTVWPTQESLRCDDAIVARTKAMQERVGRKLVGCQRRVVGWEVRWYSAPDRFAVVNRSGVILWFTVDQNGHVFTLKGGA